MKVVLLLVALLQSAGLTNLLSARTVCVQHQASVTQHHGHDDVPATDLPADEHTDCTHCPPADCARHASCGATAVALTSDLETPTQVPVSRNLALASGTSRITFSTAPPTRPPRLIA